MSRYIDAEAVKEEFTCKGDEWINNIIDSAPSIDIVRCKECKWHDTCCRNIYEDWRDATPTVIEYCSHGERIKR